MIRKGTAVILLWLMSVTIVTSQPTLQYCLCLDAVFVEGCPCPAAEKVAVTSSCGFDSNSPDCESLAPPCGECSVDLVYKMGDFVCTSAHDLGPTNLAWDSPILFLSEAIIARKACFLASIHGIRDGPPPPLVFASVPHRLRYSVFLV